MQHDARFPRSEPQASGEGGAEGAHKGPRSEPQASGASTKLVVEHEAPRTARSQRARFPRSEPTASGASTKLVIVDAVGTLIRPRQPIGATYADVAAAHGVRIPAWRLEDAFARVLRSAAPMPPGDDAAESAWWRERVRETFRAADQMQRFADFEACFAALFDVFARPDAWLAAPGAHEALEALRRAGLRVAIASNFDHRLPAILAGLDLARLADLVWLPRDAGTAKPDPAFFTRACERLGIAPAAAVAVGDDPELDLAAARSAGLAAIDVATLASLAELPARIAALRKEAPEETR